MAYRKNTMIGSVSLHSLFRSESGSWTSYYYTIIRSCRHCRAETWVDFASIFRLSHRNGKSKRCPSALDSSRRILLILKQWTKPACFLRVDFWPTDFKLSCRVSQRNSESKQKLIKMFRFDFKIDSKSPNMT